MRRPHTLFILGAVLFVGIPAVILSDSIYQSPLLRVMVVVNLLCTWAFFLLSYGLLQLLTKKSWPKKMIAFLAALYYLFVSFEVLYKVFTGMRFDMFYMLDSLEEVRSTIINVLGVDKLILIALGLLLLGVLYFCLFHAKCSLLTTRVQLQLSWKKGGVMMTGVLVVLAAVPSAQGKLRPDYFYDVTLARNEAEYLMPDVEISSALNGENLFMLQLESGNAMALQGLVTVGEKSYTDNYMPRISEMSKEGVFFPFFWSQSPMTNRAQVNVLCGLTNNLGAGLSYHPEQIPKDCLPQILKKKGYTTLMFRSDDLEFSNTGNFMKAIGFDEVHYKDIMRPNDHHYDWGYDDCTFYDRVFAYLRKNYPDPEKLFVYVEVSSHHYPFDPKSEYGFTHIFPTERSLWDQYLYHKFNKEQAFIEKYLNSFQAQDYCASKFYEEFKSFQSSTKTSSHFFLFPDHSWPVGMHQNMQAGKNLFNENSLIFLSYFGPRAQKGTVIEKRFGNTDILPTALELLTGTQHIQNSFAFALEGRAPEAYESCQVLIQPYSGGEVAVVRDDEKVVYSIEHKVVHQYDLSTDMEEEFPEVIEEEMSYDRFKEKYYCERYKSKT